MHPWVQQLWKWATQMVDMVQYMLLPPAEGEETPIVWQLPVEIPVSSWPVAPVWTVDPSATSSNGQTGTAIVLNTGTLSTADAKVISWLRDGTAFPAWDGLTSPVPDATWHGHNAQAYVRVSGWQSYLDRVTAPILLVNPSAPSSPAVLTTGQLLDVSVVEITDDTDPDANAGGGARRWTFGPSIPTAAGWTLKRSSWTTDGFTPPGTAVVASTVVAHKNSFAPTTVLYHYLAWVNDTDGTVAPALPTSGVIGSGQSLTAASSGGGEILMTIQGYAGAEVPSDWTAVNSTQVTAAIAAPLGTYTRSGGAGSNMTLSGPIALVLAYESYRGNTSTDVRCLQQARTWIASSTMPCGNCGPAAARESFAVSFFIMVMRTPRLLAGGTPGGGATPLSAGEQAKILTILRGILLVQAWQVSDTNGTRRYLTGFYDTEGLKGVSPNISQGPPHIIMMIAAHLGVSYVQNFLETITIQNMRTEAGSVLGTSSNLYSVLNYANAGRANGDGLYRSGASADVPSNSVINAALRTWRYYGSPVSDFSGILFLSKPTNKRGWFSTFPFESDGHPQGLTLGRVQTGIGATAPTWISGGLLWNGRYRGYILNNAEDMPWLGTIGCMIYEHNGRDEGKAGGPSYRFSLNYASWTLWDTSAFLLGMEVCGALAHGSTIWDAALVNYAKYVDIYEFCADTDNGFNSYAHGGENDGGAGGPEIFDPDIYKSDIHIGLIRAYLPRVAPI